MMTDGRCVVAFGETLSSFVGFRHFYDFRAVDLVGLELAEQLLDPALELAFELGAGAVSGG